MNFAHGSPAWFKFALMESGVHIQSDAQSLIAELYGDRPLTLADYASTSGISLILPGDIYANVPVETFNPNFVKDPPFTLSRRGDGLFVNGRGAEQPVRFVPVPNYHKESNHWGEAYTSYAFTHTDRVRISPVEGCAYTCKFCDLPYEFRYRTKRVDGLVDSVRRALVDPVQPAAHVLISGGVPRPADFGYFRETYQRVAKEFADVAVDIMMVPAPGLLDLDEIASVGIHQLSINLELYNDEAAKKIMPRKARQGRDSYLAFIERALERLGPRSVRSLLLVGLEPTEETLNGVRVLAERGCEPVLSPFRPDPSTPLGNGSVQPPKLDVMIEVFERATEIAHSYGVKLGPRCIPCMHNTMTIPDGSDFYTSHAQAALAH